MDARGKTTRKFPLCFLPYLLFKLCKWHVIIGDSKARIFFEQKIGKKAKKNEEW